MTNRIDERLRDAMASGRTILAPFVTLGFPDVDTSLDVVDAALEAGADIVELGVPFSDPLAEGTTIQMTSFRALQQGVTVGACLDAVRRLRGRNPDAPLILMGYYNPFLRYGLERFARDASAAGVDGLIVPDLPAEEAGALLETAGSRGLRLIPLLAPTSTEERIALSCKGAGGFIYCVSLTGVTGARVALREGLSGLVGKIRRHTDLPILVGFGISTPEHVREVSQFSDGAIFGSALIDAIADVPSDRAAQKAREFVAGMRAAGP